MNTNLALYSLATINQAAKRLGTAKQDAYNAGDHNLCKQFKLEQQRLYTLKALAIRLLVQQGVLRRERRCITDSGCLLDSYGPTVGEQIYHFHSISFQQEARNGEYLDKFSRRHDSDMQSRPYLPCVTHLLSLLPAKLLALYNYLNSHDFRFCSNGQYQDRSSVCTMLDTFGITVACWRGGHYYNCSWADYHYDLFLGTQQISSIAVEECDIDKRDYDTIFNHLYYREPGDSDCAIGQITVGKQTPENIALCVDISDDTINWAGRPLEGKDPQVPIIVFVDKKRFPFDYNAFLVNHYRYKELYHLAGEALTESGIAAMIIKNRFDDTGSYVLTQHGKDLLADATLKRWGVRAVSEPQS